MEEMVRTTDRHASTLPPDGDWSPMLFVVKDDKATIVGIEMPPNELRDWWFGTIIPNVIHKVEPNPDLVAILVSSWMKQMDEDEDLENLNVMPSESPDRKECLILYGVSAEEEITKLGEIIRGGEHPELEWSEPEGVQGRVQGALRRAVWT